MSQPLAAAAEKARRANVQCAQSAANKWNCGRIKLQEHIRNVFFFIKTVREDI